MSGEEALAAGLLVALAALVQGAAGFGFALLAAPVLLALLDPVEAVSALALLGLIVNTVTLGADRRRPTVLTREAAALLAWAAPGLPLGAVVLTRVPADALRVAVGVLVLGAVAQRARPGGAGAHAWRIPSPVAGLSAGALTTATGLNGPPLVLRLTAPGITPAARRDTLAALFLVLGVLGTAVLAAGGVFAPPAATAPFALAVAAGTLAGRRLGGALTPRADRWVVGALLVGAGLASIAAGLT